MNYPADDNQAISEDLWRAWAQKGKMRERAIARRLMWITAIGLVIAAVGASFYVFAAK